MENKKNSDRMKEQYISEYNPYQPLLEVIANEYCTIKSRYINSLQSATFYDIYQGHKGNIVLLPDVSLYVLLFIKENTLEIHCYYGIRKIQTIAYNAEYEVLIIRINPELIYLFSQKQYLKQISKSDGNKYTKSSITLNMQTLIRYKTFHQKVDFLIHIWEKDMILEDSMEHILRDSILKLYKTKGNVSMENLANMTGYGTRYLRILYQRYFKLSPKTFAKILRMQYTLRLILENPMKQSTQIALKAGFSDGAHLNREMKQLLQMNLSEWKTGKWKEYL